MMRIKIGSYFPLSMPPDSDEAYVFPFPCSAGACIAFMHVGRGHHDFGSGFLAAAERCIASKEQKSCAHSR
jgi:hypothetical protein